MFENVLPLNTSGLLNRERQITIVEVLPIRIPEHRYCSYCGKEKRVAYHFTADDGGKAVTCYPCADQGMNWLEQNFPGQPS